jgi:hypothetical protein
MEQRPSWEAESFSVSKFPTFMEPEIALTYSQEPATGSILSQINPVYAPIMFLSDPFYYPPNYA